MFVKRMSFERMVGHSVLWSKNGCQVWHNGQMTGQSGLWSKNGCQVWHNGQMTGQSGLWSKAACEVWQQTGCGQSGLWSKNGCEVYHPDRWLARMVYGLRMVAKYGIRTDGWPEWDMI